MNLDDSTRERRDDPSHRPNLEAIVTDYVERLNDGEELNPFEILAAHPEHGAEILADLDAYASLERGGAPLGTLGDYTLRRQIGRGGMGVVYEAWQNSVERHVALKVLPAGIAADNKAFVRFMREARTAAQLSHPNVVGVHGMGQEEHTPYYAMEYVEGETLARILKRLSGAEPDTETVFGHKDSSAYFDKLARAFADVADGLQHAHSKGVVHRDIKPSNLILDGEGKLRILDFGLARLEGQESLTLSGDLMGTVQYMSPEQAMAKRIPLDHRTDIYSLGATMYEILTGAPPFRGRDQHDTLSQIIARDPRPPRQLNSKVPLDLETIVLKCLRKDPGDRYGTAEALGQDLRRFVRGDAVEARPETRWVALERRIKRHRVALSAVALAGLLMVAGLVSGIVLVNEAYQLAADDRDRLVQERERRRRELYTMRVRLADQDWKAGNFSRFVASLDECVPRADEADLRGWEWEVLKSREEENHPLKIQADSLGVVAVAWRPDGSRIASGGADGVVRIWDARSGANLLALESRGTVVRALAWAPRGGSLAAVTREGWVNAWNPLDGTELYSQPPRVKVAPPLCQQRSVCWSPDGRWLVCGSVVGSLDVRDPNSGEVSRILPTSDEDGCSPMVSFSPDGAYLAAAVRVSGHAVIWSAETWEEVRRIETGRPFLYTVAWSPDGARLATSSSISEVKIWSMRPWEDPQTIQSHPSGTLSLDWGKAGLVSAGYDGVVRIWDSHPWRERKRYLGNTNRIWNVRWSPDASRIATAGQDGFVRIWNVLENPLADKLTGLGNAVWIAGGRRIAATSSAEGSIEVIDATSGETIHSLRPESPVGPFAFHPDGRRMAIGLADGVIALWDSEQGTELRRKKVEQVGEVQALVWSPDGELLATSAADGTVHVWGARSWELTATLREHEHMVRAIEWSPDGRRVATTGDLAVVIWDRATWSPTQAVRRDEILPGTSATTRADALAWSPDGEILAAIAGWSGDTIAWQVETGRELFRIEGHVAAVVGVTWSSDGTRLATSGADNLVKIWDVSDLANPAELLVLEGPTRRRLSWSPDGRRILSSDWSRAKVWGADGED